MERAFWWFGLMNSTYMLLLLVCVALGPVVSAIVALRPKLFWHVMIFAAIWGTGPRLEGHGFVDEYLVGCVLVGGFLSFVVRRTPSRPNGSGTGLRSSTHRLVYLAFVVYLTFQSIRGAWVLGDVRMVRFLLFFPTLGLISYLMSKGEFALPSGRSICMTISISALIYFSAYLIVGLMAAAREGFVSVSFGAKRGRFDLQYYGWSGTTVAVFPAFLAMASAAFCVRDRSRRARWLGWTNLILVCLTSFYYESRTLMIAIIAYSIVFFPVLGVRRSAAACLCFVVIWFSFETWGEGYRAGFYEGPLDRAASFLAELTRSTEIRMDRVRSSDMGRRLDVIAAFYAIMDVPTRAIWGSGWYTHRYVFVPYRVEAACRYGGSFRRVTDIMRPASFNAFLIDTGLVGILLFGVNFFLTGREVILQARGDRTKHVLPLLLCLGLTVVSMFVSVNYDVILFYMTFMPSGLLEMLSRWRERPEEQLIPLAEPCSDAWGIARARHVIQETGTSHVLVTPAGP